MLHPVVRRRHIQLKDIIGSISHYTRSASLGSSRRLLTSSPTMSSSTMKLDSYAVHSKNQYAAHHLTRDMLSSSMERLAKRCKLEDIGTISNGLPIRRRRMVDLGSADGSSTMGTLKYAIHCLNSEYSQYGMPIPLHVTFEEHPASSKEKLQTCLDMHDTWFHRNDITRDILMQSFYEPLFEPESIDFMMSYICLHWLDSTDIPEGGDISDWKGLGAVEGSALDASDLEWTCLNEMVVPKHIQAGCTAELARVHLARFLALRSLEMRPGAELLLVVVGRPHEFVAPADGGSSPLTRAMKRCIDRGELRRVVLHRTIVPYFLRTVDDVEAAVEVAKTLEISDPKAKEGTIKPGALLELVDCKPVPTITKGDEDDVVDGAFDLFWSIHSHSVESAKPSEKELECIKEETRRVFHEIYDADVGVPSTFIACTLRRRTREPWGS